MLDAALRLVVARGYRATSMQAIADAAGVTKPVVYECYPSKEKLFKALVEREEERLLQGVLAALPAEPRFHDFEGLLHDSLIALLHGAAAHPDSWRVVFDSEQPGEPTVAKRVRRTRHAVLARLEEITRDFMEPIGPDQLERKTPVLAEMLLALGEASVRVMLSSGEDWTPEDLGALVARVAARGPTAA